MCSAILLYLSSSWAPLQMIHGLVIYNSAHFVLHLAFFPLPYQALDNIKHDTFSLDVKTRYQAVEDAISGE